MPSNVIFALILLALIYGIAILNAYMYDAQTAVWTAIVGVIIFVFILSSQACLTTGGCSLSLGYTS